jgi:hypothetical protein
MRSKIKNRTSSGKKAWLCIALLYGEAIKSCIKWRFEFVCDRCVAHNIPYSLFSNCTVHVLACRNLKQLYVDSQWLSAVTATKFSTLIIGGGIGEDTVGVSANPTGVLSISTPFLSKMRTFFNAAYIVTWYSSTRVQPTWPIFELHL